MSSKTDKVATRAKKAGNITWGGVKKRAWELSRETLGQWKKRLEDEIQEKASAINLHLKDLSVLYGEPVPERVVVGLQCYPAEGNQKGEPINNFVELGRLNKEVANVLYWISNPSILPTDTVEEKETDLRQNWEKVLGGLPEGYGTKQDEGDVTLKSDERSYEGLEIYKLAGDLDTSLAEVYVREGKRMNLEFVVELYKMMDEQYRLRK